MRGPHEVLGEGVAALTNQKTESRLPCPRGLKIGTKRLKIDSRQIKAPKSKPSAHSLLILHGEQKYTESTKELTEIKLKQTQKTEEDSTIQGNTPSTYTVNTLFYC